MMDRLTFLASLTKGYRTIADIGSDHGYTCIKAVSQFGVEHAYACDVAEGPLENARKNITKYGLTERITPVLSNGLLGLSAHVEAIIISGMGGILIKNILANSLVKAQKSQILILQPNSDVPILRKFLFDNKFSFLREELILDHLKYYHVLVVKPNDEAIQYDELDVLFGPLLRKDKPLNFLFFYQKQKEQLLENYQKANDESKNAIERKIVLINQVLDEETK